MTDIYSEDDNVTDENGDLIDNTDFENEDDQKNPGTDPECPVSGTDEDNGIECEFEVRDGCWWCSTHNCWS